MICKYSHCEIYPFYGLAPHNHNLKNGSFIGSTVMKDKKDWPKNFTPDPEDNGMGTYYCPDCLKGKSNA